MGELVAQDSHRVAVRVQLDALLLGEALKVGRDRAARLQIHLQKKLAFLWNLSTQSNPISI